MFSSDYSNKNAERVGYKTDAEIKYEEIAKLHPEFELSRVKSKAMTIKSLVC